MLEELIPKRQRRLLMIPLVLGIVFAGIALVLTLKGSSSSDPNLPKLAVTPAPPPVDPLRNYIAIADTVRRGDTLSGILLRNRISVQDIGKLQRQIREQDLFSPRRLRPGQVLTLWRDEYGRFRRMRYEMSPETIHLFEFRADSVTASLEVVDRRDRLRKFEGVVRSSFDEAIRKAGGDYRLTLKVSDVLAYDVDFFTEVREGDRFDLLVEEKWINGKLFGYGEILYASYEGERASCEAVAYDWEDGQETKLGGHYGPNGDALKKAFLRSPLNYRRISSKFGSRRHPILKRVRHHDGIDYAAATGTPVQALGSGVIDYRGWKGAYGNTVRIRHNKQMQTLYGHLNGFAAGIKKGARVEQGQTMGYVGQTGLATGPHLHFEVIESGRQINPLNLKNEPADPIPAEERAAFLDWASQLRALDHLMVAGQVLDPFVAEELPEALAQVGPEGAGSLR